MRGVVPTTALANRKVQEVSAIEPPDWALAKQFFVDAGKQNITITTGKVVVDMHRAEDGMVKIFTFGRNLDRMKVEVDVNFNEGVETGRVEVVQDTTYETLRCFQKVRTYRWHRVDGSRDYMQLPMMINIYERS